MHFFCFFPQIFPSWIRIHILNADPGSRRKNECGSGSTALICDLSSLCVSLPLSMVNSLSRNRVWISDAARDLHRTAHKSAAPLSRRTKSSAHRCPKTPLYPPPPPMDPSGSVEYVTIFHLLLFQFKKKTVDIQYFVSAGGPSERV